MNRYIGSHISIDRGLLKAADLIKSSGGNIMQIYVGTPNTKEIKYLDNTSIDQFKQYLEKNKMKVVIHSSHIYNIASNWDEHNYMAIGILNDKSTPSTDGSLRRLSSPRITTLSSTCMSRSAGLVITTPASVTWPEG